MVCECRPRPRGPVAVGSCVRCRRCEACCAVRGSYTV
ncbi:hypothetical protein FKM82_027243 [Ascaphus truei]